MSTTLANVLKLIERGDVRVSAHGYDELAADDIAVHDVISGVVTAVIVEDYPDYHRGPAVLMLQFDSKKAPIHVLWGIPKGHSSPAVLVTAYRPDPARWSRDFTQRVK